MLNMLWEPGAVLFAVGLAGKRPSPWCPAAQLPGHVPDPALALSGALGPSQAG